jgi:hypothetical protein
VPRIMCCASWSTTFRRAAKSKTDNIRLLHNHLLLLLLLPIVGNVHSHRSRSRLLLLLSVVVVKKSTICAFRFPWENLKQWKVLHRSCQKTRRRRRKSLDPTANNK